MAVVLAIPAFVCSLVAGYLLAPTVKDGDLCIRIGLVDARNLPSVVRAVAVWREVVWDLYLRCRDAERIRGLAPYRVHHVGRVVAVGQAVLLVAQVRYALVHRVVVR